MHKCKELIYLFLQMNSSNLVHVNNNNFITNRPNIYCILFNIIKCYNVTLLQ